MNKRTNFKFIYGYLIIITVSVAYDIYEEFPMLSEDGFLFHFLLEVFILVISLAGLVYFFGIHLSEMELKDEYKKQLELSRQELSDSNIRFYQLKHDFLKIINEQFDNWKLSPVEKEIGLLLIKGLSFEEIAEVRQTTPKTARKQAVSLYSKSNLKNRNEFAAWFLEDLL